MAISWQSARVHKLHLMHYDDNHRNSCAPAVELCNLQDTRVHKPSYRHHWHRTRVHNLLYGSNWDRYDVHTHRLPLILSKQNARLFKQCYPDNPEEIIPMG